MACVYSRYKQFSSDSYIVEGLDRDSNESVYYNASLEGWVKDKNRATLSTKSDAENLIKELIPLESDSGVKVVSLRQFSNENEDLSEVKAKTKIPEGTFTKKAEEIKKIILGLAKDKTHAIRMINFYINRAGDNLSNAKEVMKAKQLIEES